MKMKLLRSAVIALAIGVVSISTASARDSFSLGINIGGYGYAPPVTYYPAPPVVYYSQPIYYAPLPMYYPPVVSYQYIGYRDYDRGWRHEGRDHHGWGHGDRGDWNRRGHDEGRHGGYR
jgi:hypothetical protein